MEVSSTNPFKLLESVQKTDQVCPKHHVTLVRLPGKEPFCPQCTRERIKAREQQTALDAEAFWRKRKTTDMLKRDSIFDDPDLRGATFGSFQPVGQEAEANWNLARKLAYAYLDPATKFNTLFTGSPGRGKSHLALSMLTAVNENAETPMSCLFVSVNELMRRIRDSFNYPDSKYTEEAMVNLLGRADLLVLDDVGSESSFKRDSREASEFTQNVLFGILNRRNRTIITTNLNSQEMSAIYNPKLLSRMYKGINGHIIKFTDATPDRRSVEF